MAEIDPILEFGINLRASYSRLDDAIANLDGKGLVIPNLNNNAALRIKYGPDQPFSTEGNIVCECVIYEPRYTPQIVPMAPFRELVRSCSEKIKTGEEFRVSGSLLRDLLAMSEEFTNSSFLIPTNRLGSERLPAMLFGGSKRAQEYGHFLKNQGINQMPIEVVDNGYVNCQFRPFIRMIYFAGIKEEKPGILADRRVGYDLFRGIKLQSS